MPSRAFSNLNSRSRRQPSNQRLVPHPGLELGPSGPAKRDDGYGVGCMRQRTERSNCQELTRHFRYSQSARAGCPAGIWLSTDILRSRRCWRTLTLPCSEPSQLTASTASRRRCRWLPVAEACEIHRWHTEGKIPCYPSPRSTRYPAPRGTLTKPRCPGPTMLKDRCQIRKPRERATRLSHLGPTGTQPITRFIRCLDTTSRPGHRPFTR